MRTVNMLDAKTNLSKLVSDVESGVETEVIIARNGRPVARIVAVGKLAVEHADPFDRLLIAQALSEPMLLVSNDQKVVACLPQLALW